ncbi:Sodium Bile acid symporter family protein [Clostridium perfringens]|uniref:arsenic resistance protein n=1 Tax=Clostridium perfringens TaxID=1502 RepID=UPI0024696EF9|nr:bile acid:sodium symporter [Clostridium perfringens]MDH5074790.1 Sodium Bile acid symporter family protein [Clostridium perfringens]
MSKLDKLQTPILLVAIILGLLLGQLSWVKMYAENFVTPFLFVMLFGVFLNIPLRDYKKSFTNIKFSVTTVMINFIWTPILIWLLGKIFLSASPIMQIGLIMLMVTPCTDWYLIFTGMVKGNVPLSTTILPLNLVLQVVLLPVYLFIFGGASGTINIKELLISILIMLIIPFILAQITKVFLEKIKKENIKNKIYTFFSSLQIILLSLAIMAMFASKGSSLISNLNIVIMFIPPIIMFYIINFTLSQFVGKKFKYSYEDTASLTLTTIAKNSPMTLGVALMAFPNEPIIHLIMLIEPLIELPSMMIITRILVLIRKRQKINEASEYSC